MSETTQPYQAYEALDKLGQKLFDKLKKAKEARAASGMEQRIKEDSEFYEGIDNANREEHTRLTKESVEYHRTYDTETTGSTVFLNITRPYVDNASASLIDMLLPIEEAPFTIEPTPIPTLQDMAKKLKGVQLQSDIGTRDIGESAQQVIDSAKEKADKALLRIEDWLEECQFNAELRKVMRDVIKIGTGVLEGPVPVKRKSQKVTHDDAGNIQIEIVIETTPASSRIDPLDLYPDPACGNNIHNGNYVFKRQKLSGKQLRALLGTPGDTGESYYLDNQIKRVLKEGPDRCYAEQGKDSNDNDKYDVYYYYGTATHDDITAAGMAQTKDDMIYDVVMVMVNGRVIKASLSVFDSGKFPFDVMVYQERDDHWSGTGLARLIRAPQRMLVAAVRNLLDNAGISGSPMLVVGEGVEMEDGSPLRIGRHSILRISPDSPIQDARQAVNSIVIPMISQELLSIIQFAQKMAEDVTGMPLLLQGQQGSAPDTVGGMQILQQNSSAPRKAIAKLFDDRIIVPHIQRYYEWLMIHSSENDEKGDYQIVAKGSTVFFERDASKMALMQMGAMLANPAFGINPANYMKEVLKAHRINADNLLYTDEELKQMQEQASQAPPEDPALQVAKLKADTELQKAQLQQQAMQQEMQLKIQLEQAKIQFDQVNQEAERAHALRLAEMQREIKIMELSEKSNISINQIKAQLAQTAQKLNVQTALSKEQQRQKNKPAIAPPTEPTGKAQTGRSFEQ